MPRKHLVASQTNKKQQLQAKIWQKLAREIKAAAKIGGTNPEANPRLKAAIDKALQNNLSRDSIEKNINGSQKDADSLTSLEYECYGPNGIQIIVKALTDNTNRTSSNLRGYLSKLDGKIAKTNSVKMFFDSFGVIVVPKKNGIDVDLLLEKTLNFEIKDIIDCEDSFEIQCNPNDFYLVKDALLKDNIQIFDSEIKLVAQTTISNLSDETYKKVEKFIDNCDNDDDIQTVIANIE